MKSVKLIYTDNINGKKSLKYWKHGYDKVPKTNALCDSMCYIMKQFFTNFNSNPTSAEFCIPFMVHAHLKLTLTKWITHCNPAHLCN